MGKVGEVGDANNRTIGISLPQRGSFWGHTHFLGTNLRPPTKLFFPVDYSITKWSQHVLTTSTAKKKTMKSTPHISSHHIMAAHPKAGMQIWCKGVGAPWCPPWNKDSKLRVASPTIPVRRIGEDQDGPRRILLKNWLGSYRPLMG